MLSPPKHHRLAPDNFSRTPRLNITARLSFYYDFNHMEPILQFFKQIGASVEKNIDKHFDRD
jgi:hypothetical protein